MRELRRTSARFVRFGIVGALGVVVNSVVLFLVHGVFGLPLLLASALAVETAIIHNFIWNERWTFGEPSFSVVRLGKFNLTSLGGLLITLGVLHLMVEYGKVHYLLANLAGIALATAWNFALSLFWTWG